MHKKANKMIWECFNVCVRVYRQQIMAVLNAQTAVQFQQYAKQQHPDNPEQQQILIQQLQEQHYQQYMQQALRLQQVQVEPETYHYNYYNVLVAQLVERDATDALWYSGNTQTEGHFG